MQEEKFKPGDVVELKSGSPKMTVVKVEEEYANIIYFNKIANDFKDYPKLPIVSLVLSAKE